MGRLRYVGWLLPFTIPAFLWVAAGRASGQSPDPGAATPGDSKVVMAMAPGAPPVDALTIRVPVGMDGAARNIFVRQDGAQPLEDVVFRATTLVDVDEEDTGAGVCFAEHRPDPATPCSDLDATIPASGSELSLFVSISGLDQLGTFTSTLYAKTGDSIDTLGTLTVIRAVKTGVLSARPIQTARAMKWLPWCRTTTEFRVAVKNEGLKQVKLNNPAISAISIGGDDSTFAVTPPQLEVLNSADGLTLDPGEEIQLDLKLSDLRFAGSYSGSFVISADGVEPVDATFAVNVKESFVPALFLIALGVGTAYWLRRLGGSGRALLIQQRNVTIVVDDLRRVRKGIEHPTKGEREALDALERRLQGLYEDLALSMGAKADDVLNEVRAKLDLVPKLVEDRLLVDGITPESLRELFFADLGKVVDFIKQTSAADALKAGLDVQTKILTEMPQKIREAVRKSLVDQITDFKDQITPFTTSLPAVSAIIANLETASSSVDDSLATLQGIFETARREFATVAADDLISSLPPETAPPIGFDTSTWPPLRSRTVASLEAVAKQASSQLAVTKYMAAANSYIEEMATKLQRDASNNLAIEAGADRKRLWQEVVDHAREAQRKASSQDLGAARTALDQAQKKRVELVPAGERMGAARPSSGQTPALPLALEGGEAASMLHPQEPPESVVTIPAKRDLDKKLKKEQRKFAAVVFGVAVVTGLSILWAPVATWGDFTSYAAAFLWGLGLHKVGENVFDLTKFSGGLAGEQAGGTTD